MLAEVTHFKPINTLATKDPDCIENFKMAENEPFCTCSLPGLPIFSAVSVLYMKAGCSTQNGEYSGTCALQAKLGHISGGLQPCVLLASYEKTERGQRDRLTQQIHC